MTPPHNGKYENPKIQNYENSENCQKYTFASLIKIEKYQKRFGVLQKNGIVGNVIWCFGCV